MYKKLLENNLKTAVKQLGFEADDVVVSIPEKEGFGDYSTNVALQLSKQPAKKSYQSALEVANDLIETLGHPDYLERVEVAGPGFINFFVKNEALLKVLSEDLTKESETEEIPTRSLVEFGHPNTHKTFHIGHLRTLTLGESISRILEYAGHEVFRANYGSDIGPTVAKCLYGIQQNISEYDKIKPKSLREKVEFLGQCYALGHAKFEEDDEAKKAIKELTKKLYLRDLSIVPLWQETKDWCQAYFETIYLRAGTEFDAQIWESEIEGLGKTLVERYIGPVFKEDQGAVIFPGEKFGLHNRVFLTGEGHPTYEGKELGLTERERELFPYDESIHVVDAQQTGFFEVVIKAIELIDETMKGKKRHLPYGFVTLTTGKMSSRLGNIITAESLVDQVREEIAKLIASENTPSKDQLIDQIAWGAIKFSYLKYAHNSNIKFDIKSSVSLEGDSGPYVQYTYARTQSVLEKASSLRHQAAGNQNTHASTLPAIASLEPEERLVLQKLEYFSGVLDQVVAELAPNLLTEYLVELARVYNMFYQKYPILKSEKEALRLALTKKVGESLELGLYLLGIAAPARM